jgi:hypothetical protein
MKSLLHSNLTITLIVLFVPLLSYSQDAKDVDLSVDKIYPAIKGSVPNGDIDDTDYPFFGGYKYVPKHIIGGFNTIGLPVNHPGSESINFDWQLTLTKNPGGASSVVFDQTESFTLSTGESDIITFGSQINQNEVGNYRLSATLSSTSDGNFANNSVDLNYVISDTEYGFADKNNITSTYALHDNPTAANGDGVGVVCYFPEPTDDPYVINSVSVYVSDEYTGVIDNGNAFIIGVIWPRNDVSGNWDFSSGGVSQTNPLNLTSNDLNKITTLDFTPLEISQESDYLVAIHIVNGGDATDGGRVSFGADPNKTAPNDLTCVQIIGSSAVPADFTPAIWANVEAGSNPVNTDANITSFSIPGQVNSSVDQGGQVISVTMPGGTNLTNLAPTFSLSAGASATVSGVPQVSGVTANDFSVPVVYTVTAEDGTTNKNWTVNVDIAASSETEIVAYSIAGQTNSSVNAGAHTINVTVPNGTSLNNLVATFTLSAGASAKVGGTTQVSGTTANNFTSPVSYVVTAEDGTTTQNWTVTVTESASTAAEILTYSIAGQTSSSVNAGAHTINVTVPNGTSLNNLVATFTLSAGATVKVGGTTQVSGTTANNFTSPVTYVVTAEDGTTTQNWTVTVTESASTAAEILTYSIAGQTNSSVNAGAHTIDVAVPNGTDLTNLVATFTLSAGASAKVGGTTQVSGTTANNFTSPVTYVVTAEDGTTTQNWTVTVTESASTAAEILTYSIAGQTNSSVNAGAHTIDVAVPNGTDLTNLVATFTLSAGATVKVGGTTQVSGTTANNFTSPVTYVVTAEDGTTTQNWTVTVTESASTAAEILTYSIAGQTNSNVNAGAHTIDVAVPNGTDLTNLVATFTLSAGATVKVGGTTQVSGTTANNFTSPVTYVVTAEDGTTTQNWTVTVTEGASTAAEILTYSISGQTNSSVNAGAHTINVTVPNGTSLNNLVATFTLSAGASAKVGGTTQVSGTTANNFTSPVTYVVTAEDGTTTQNWTVTVTESASTAAEILTYSIAGQTSSSVNAGAHTINVTVPNGTSLNNLVATFTLSAGASAKVGGTTQVSGTTANNFTSPVTYVVTAEDGTTTQNWTVTVTEEASTATEMLTYSIAGQTSSTINSGSINVVVPHGTNLSNLVATFTLSDGAIARVGGVLQLSGVTANDFASPVDYVVTAEDGVTTSVWTVTVQLPTAGPNDFISFSINGNEGEIDLQNALIRVEVPAGTDVSQLVADFEVTNGTTVKKGSTVQESGVTSNNFSDIVTYRLYPETGASRKWYVDVVEQGNMSSAASIVYFGFYGQTQPAEIDNSNKSISVNLDENLNVTQLIPIFYISQGALAFVDNKLQWSGQNVIDFTTDVIYTIVAEDGVTIEEWTVQVTNNQNAAAEILDFSFIDIPGSSQITNIDLGSRSVNVQLPEGTPRDALTADFVLSSGATAKVGGVTQQSGVTVNDFSSPVVYKITSQNGLININWIVNVSYYVGIGEYDDFAFSIYPNPANNLVNIELAEIHADTKLTIVNMVGKIKHMEVLNSMQAEVSLDGFDSGLYFVILHNSEQKYIKKLIVK